MEPLPPPPPPPSPAPEPSASASDTSSLGAGVVVGLLGVPLLVLAFWSVFGGLAGMLPSSEALAQLVILVGGAGTLAIIIGAPMWAYRKGWRRMGQGVLIGYGIVAVVVGGCFVFVLYSLSTGSFH